MKTKEEHKVGDSFTRSMKLVAMDTIQLPLDVEDAREILHHGGALLKVAVVAPLIRMAALVLFPFSVPLFAVLFRREAKRMDEWRKIARGEIHKIKRDAVTGDFVLNESKGN